MGSFAQCASFQLIPTQLNIIIIICVWLTEHHIHFRYHFFLPKDLASGDTAETLDESG